MTEPRKITRADTSAGYLPVLPAGWEYDEVNIVSDRETVTITTSPTDDNPHRRAIASNAGGQTRHAYADTLPEALRVAAAAVKALDVVEQQEKAIRAAKAEALDLFGEPEAEPVEVDG